MIRALPICMCALMAVLPAMAGSTKKSKVYSLNQLRTQSKMPKVVRIRENPKRPGQAIGAGRRNADATEKSAGMLLGLSKSGTQMNRPFYQIHLARVLVDLDYDPAAFQTLADIDGLSPKAPYNRSLWGFRSIGQVKRYGKLLESRILARNGHDKESLNALKGASPRTGYEHVLAAEVYALLGRASDAERSLRRACKNTSGHPERNFGWVFIPMRATVLARVLGKPNLAQELAHPIIKRGPNAQKWPQYKAAWQIANITANNSKQGEIELKRLKSGTYTGVCRGYVGDIHIAVTVKSGRLTSLKITKTREDRPYSALKVVPERIIRKQSLIVDAVSGATITSNAIQAATDQALLKGKK